MSSLDEEQAFQCQDVDMLDEDKRVESFKKWAHKTGPCTKETMAKAGFYHCNLKDWPDLVRCVFCLCPILDWEKDDDPWECHRQGNPECIFARLAKSQKDLTYQEMAEIIGKRNIIMINHYHGKKIELLDEKIKKLQEFMDRS